MLYVHGGENVDSRFQQLFNILPALRWRERALLCASSSIKSAPDAGRGRHPWSNSRICRPRCECDVLRQEWSARRQCGGLFTGHASLPRRSPHPAPALESRRACASIARALFRHLQQAPKKIFNFRWAGAFVPTSDPIRTQRGSSFISLCVPQRIQRQIAQHSPPPVTAPAACAYILQPVARPVQRSESCR